MWDLSCLRCVFRPFCGGSSGVVSPLDVFCGAEADVSFLFSSSSSTSMDIGVEARWGWEDAGVFSPLLHEKDEDPPKKKIVGSPICH